MAEDGDVLLARTLALDRQLQTLRAALTVVAEETRAVVALRTIRHAAHELMADVHSAVSETERLFWDADSASWDLLAAVRMLPDTIRGFLTLVTEEATQVSEESPIDPAGWQESLSQIENRIDYHRSELIRIRRQIQAGEGLDPAGPRLWREFSQLQREHTLLLGDSFSLLSGAWTRRMQVDQGVFAVVDRLQKEIGDHRSRGALAIPAEVEISFEGTSAVALQFADTSVWNLPVVAHEYGHLLPEGLNP
jgi:hypothetical protein